jgi:hypothetical protein
MDHNDGDVIDEPISSTETGMRQEIIDLYDASTREEVNRRVFLDRLATISGEHRGRHSRVVGPREQLPEQRW